MCLQSSGKRVSSKQFWSIVYREFGDDFSHFVVVDFHAGVYRAGQGEEIRMRKCHLGNGRPMIGDMFRDFSIDQIEQPNTAASTTRDGHITFTRDRQRSDGIHRSQSIFRWETIELLFDVQYMDRVLEMNRMPHPTVCAASEKGDLLLPRRREKSHRRTYSDHSRPNHDVSTCEEEDVYVNCRHRYEHHCSQHSSTSNHWTRPNWSLQWHVPRDCGYHYQWRVISLAQWYYHMMLW